MRKAFTLVELIVVITILAILGTIAYISLLGYGVAARDTVRISDISSIVKVIELYKLQEGTYPPVSDPINITFSGSTIWQQGSFGDNTRKIVRRISETPIDPMTSTEFAYAVTQSTQEYQIGAIVEDEGSLSYNTFPGIGNAVAAENSLPSFATSVVKGNYNGKFIAHRVGSDVYILGVPSILANEITDVTLQDVHANQSFVYEGSSASPHTYLGTVADKGDWVFNPTDTSGAIEVIHQTTINDLNSGIGKTNFIGDLQKYYESTDVANTSDFTGLATIDTTNNPEGAIALANNYIQGEVGGLGGGFLTTTDIDTQGPDANTVNTYAQVYNGGDYSSAMNNYGGFYNSPVHPNTKAFSGLKGDKSITSWGSGTNGGGTAPAGNDFTKIYSNQGVFAALKADGSISVWGYALFGGTGAPAGNDFVNIYSTQGAFTGLREDGSIVSWGYTGYGGGDAPSGNDFVSIYSTQRAFAALKSDGSIEAWGGTAHGGGTDAPVGNDFVSVYATQKAFAGLKSDGSIEAWGDDSYRAVADAPSGSDFTKIYSTQGAFAALNADGSISTWGDDNYGGGTAPSGNDFTKIYSNNHAFAALNTDGNISVWGDNSYGGGTAPSGNNFTRIYSTQGAFAALNTDGSISAWGDVSYGGGTAPSGNGFTKIYATQKTFAALKADGSISAWGDDSYGGVSDAPTGNGFVKIFSTERAFAAIKADGTIETWGDLGAGGGMNNDQSTSDFVSINGY